MRKNTYNFLTFHAAALALALQAAISTASATGNTLHSWDTSSYSGGGGGTIPDGRSGTIGLSIGSAPSWITAPNGVEDDADAILKTSNLATGGLSAFTTDSGGLDVIRQIPAVVANGSSITYTWTLNFASYDSLSGVGATDGSTVILISDLKSGLAGYTSPTASTGKGTITFSAAVMGGGSANFSLWNLKVAAPAETAVVTDPWMGYTFSGGVLSPSSSLASGTGDPDAVSPRTGNDTTIAALTLPSTQRYTSITMSYKFDSLTGGSATDNWAFGVATAVPEASTAGLLLGLGGMLAFRRRR